MRRPFVTLLLGLSTAVVLTKPVIAVEDLGGDTGFKLTNASMSKELRERTTYPGPVVVSSDPETIWVGYWSGANPANNYWKVGGLPSGAGNRAGTGDGVWSFEAGQHIHGDTLGGWWAVRHPHENFSGATRADENRLWWAVEYGNIVNHAGNPGGGTRRTIGVTGMWHRDAGANAVQVLGPLSGATPHNPSWTPLVGSYSAWMGMRAHGDLTCTDPVTGNPYNAATQAFLAYGTVATAGTGTTPRLLPGYIGNMDQMLYRNINVSGYSNAGIAVRFRWRTDMSTLKDSDPRFRTGWFEGDWLSGNSPTPGNFISAEADNGTGPNSAAPVDSLQLYIGAPVEGTWKSSLYPGFEGLRPIQDDDRRWFNEVLDKEGRLWLFGAAGINAAQQTTVNISDANVQALLTVAAANGQSGKLRLCFRVHTNRAFDDGAGSSSGSYNSGYAGAAVIDDVQIDTGAGFVTVGDFEASNTIDNNLSPDAAWQSTGKPPGEYFHPEYAPGNLIYQDVCGDFGSPNRICDLSGVVINMGLHDQGEAATDPNPHSSEHEGAWGLVSPAINLAGANQASSDPARNNMNLTASERWATNDYYLYYDIYTGCFDVMWQGQMWQPFVHVYPQVQADGVAAWGGASTPGFLMFNAEKQCFADLEPCFANGLLVTSNANGMPDSIRVGLRKLSECYRFGVTTGCSPLEGGYIDNCSFAIVDGAPQLMGIDPWDLFQDAFPANETAGLAGTAALDTAAAHVKIGLNTAPTTGDLWRYNVPGDSATVQAVGDSIRLDLLFRVRPGVGNYNTVGNMASGLRDFGTGFFASYRANPGLFSGVNGTVNQAAALAAHAAAPSGWSALVWNSARMDTTEESGHATFPVQGIHIQNPPAGTQWCTTYHETDLAGPRAALGVARNRCFVIDTTVTNLNDPNVTCGDPGKGPYPPTWVTTVPQSRTGWNGTTTTTEGTKIIPDGLLTPGAHVQYFIRRQDLINPTTTFAMAPDTNLVSPQRQEGSTDGHRWQQFGVLPDRWKDSSFGVPGAVGSGACFLFVDDNDRRGNERVWKGVTDTTCSTAWVQRGNGDGYAGVPSGTSVNTPAYYVNKNYQMGTLWDAYQLRAPEALTTTAGRIGARLAYRGAFSPMADNGGKWGRIAPTPDMLDAYYKTMVVLTGDLNSSIWGPFADATDDDIAIFQGWLGAGNTATPDRGILIIGESFVEAAFDQGPPQQSFVTDHLATTFQDPNYLLFVPDNRPYADVEVENVVDLGAGYIYGVNNSCMLTNDVVDVNSLVPHASIDMEYRLPNRSLLPLGVTKAHDATNPWISQTIAVDIESLRGWFSVNFGRQALLYNTLSNVFGALNCTLVGQPYCLVDVPNASDGSLFVNFMHLKNNPLTSGYATVVFGLASDDFVQAKVYDVSGRLVRTLADRKFKAGEHTLVWDGADDAGRRLPRGVYFTQLRYRESGLQFARKLTLLR